MTIVNESMKPFLDSAEEDYEIKGKTKVEDTIDFWKLVPEESRQDGTMHDMANLVSGMSERFDKIYVNIETCQVQGVIFPFVVTCQCSGNETKAYFTIKTGSNLRITYDFQKNFAVMGTKLTELAKFIKSVEG